MPLDTSKAWSEATAMVSANKDVMAAIAGVFFFLPALALALFFPQPEPPAGAQLREMMTMLEGYYRQTAPYMLVATLVQVLGQLAVLTLAARVGRATVGDAIRAAAGGLLPYLGAQALLLLAGAAVFGVIVLLAPLSSALALLLGLAAAAAVVWISVRLVMVPVVIAIEGMRSPLAVLRRSWDLTRGSAGRILLFLVVLGLAVTVIAVVASAGIGILLALIGGVEAARIGGAAVSAAIGAGFAVYVALSLAAIHRQLAGSGHSDMAVFE
ncbi:glycerophosphoryl diester phosphodiesterase membrane domain-containing protein [Novosphingobium sp. B 225]|uniref:glycerophosphoryl diester phosphodiesterase membrane domain-containing protein n=1 Tax=Novosphingobium sp. B 225 TaxID=1961849 RepID=UPI001124FE8D|nr:glycerophosphoryl diester phosphodiesterase membrane domain-containing protein [Novosphingobium sp. B 225]